jgi:hypothetical protein
MLAAEGELLVTDVAIAGCSPVDNIELFSRELHELPPVPENMEAAGSDLRGTIAHGLKPPDASRHGATYEITSSQIRS